MKGGVFYPTGGMAQSPPDGGGVPHHHHHHHQQPPEHAPPREKKLAVITARNDAEDKSKKDAEEKAKKEAEEKAKRETEEKAKRGAEEKAKKEAEERAKREATGLNATHDDNDDYHNDETYNNDVNGSPAGNGRGNRGLHVRSNQQAARSYDFPADPPFTAYLGNLAYSIVEPADLADGVAALVRDKLNANIHVLHARIMMDRRGGGHDNGGGGNAKPRHRGFAYLQVETVEELKTLMRLNDGDAFLAGRRIQLDTATRGPRLHSSNNHNNHKSNGREKTSLEERNQKKKEEREAKEAEKSSLQATLQKVQAGPGLNDNVNGLRPSRSISSHSPNPSPGAGRIVLTKQAMLGFKDRPGCKERPDSLLDMTIVRGPSRGKKKKKKKKTPPVELCPSVF